MTEFVNNRTLLVGAGALEHAIRQLTDKRIKLAFVAVYNSKAAYVCGLLQKLEENGIKTVVYDQFTGEPNLAVVDQATQLCISSECSCVIACGGGTVIDTSKLVAMMATNGGCCEDYQLNGKQVEKEPLFFVAIPTTAGTGAEATRVSVIYNEKKGFKKACYDNSMIAQTVVLDPEATKALPPRVAASTGIDAIIHAVESYVSITANTITKIYSLAAFKLLYANITKVQEHPEDVQARNNMQLGSYLAGLALAAGSGLAHIVGQPMGALYHVPHGEACSAVFLDSMRMNKDYAVQGYTQIAKTIGIQVDGRSYDEVFNELMAALEAMMEKIRVPRKITHCISRDQFDVDDLVENICECMSHLKNNPRPVDSGVYRETIELALD